MAKERHNTANNIDFILCEIRFLLLMFLFLMLMMLTIGMFFSRQLQLVIKSPQYHQREEKPLFFIFYFFLSTFG